MASTNRYNRVLKSHFNEVMNQTKNDVDLNNDFIVDDVAELENLKLCRVITDETTSQFRTDLESMIRKELEPKHYNLYFDIDATSYYDGNQSYGPDHKWLIMRAHSNMRETRSRKKQKTAAESFDGCSNYEIITALQADGLKLQYVTEQTEVMCWEAVKQNGLALQYSKVQTEDLCLEAVTHDKNALEFVDDEFVITCEQYLYDRENK